MKTMQQIIFTFILFACTGYFASGQGFYEYLLENPDASYEAITNHLDAYYMEHEKGKGSGYKQYRRWKDYASRHLDENGNLLNASIANEQAFRLYKRLHPESFTQERETHGGWEVEGPFDFTSYLGASSALGRVNRLGFHPTDPDIFYACTPAGGLWKTTDHGDTWACLTDHLPVIGCSGIVVDPNNDDILYLLTGDGDGTHTASIGVIKSLDGGGTWQKTGLSWPITDHVRAFKLDMHPTNTNTLFMATSKGLFRTTDAGGSWNLVHSGLFTDFEFMPTNPSRMYATRKDGFFRSINSGASFTEINDPDFPSQFLRIEIAVTPADSSYVYLLFGGHISGTGNGTFSGFYHSDDFGSDFDLMANTPNILGYEITGGDSLNQGFYDLALAADPINSDNVMAGGVNTWRSTNKGVTWGNYSHWTNLGFAFAHADFHHLVFNGTTLFAANDGGVYETTNPWDVISYFNNLSSGLCITQPYNIDVLNAEVILGSQDNGTLRWDMNNTTTATSEMGADGFDCMWDPSTPFGAGRVIYVTTQNTILRSTSDGFEFSSIGVPGYGQGDYWYTDLMIHPTMPDTIYTGVGDGNPPAGVFRSFDQGSNWTDLDFGLHKTIRSMAMAPSNSNIVAVATKDSIVITQNIHTANPVWSPAANIDLANRNILDIVFDHDNPLIMYAALGGYLEEEKIYKTVDGGANWENFSESLPNVPFHCMVIEDNAVNGVYAGCDIGVFYRNANMSDWIFFSNELPIVPVFDLVMDGGRVYAGTFGRGIWSAPQYTQCPANLVLTSSDPGNGMQAYSTSQTITSSQLINGGLGTDIRYNSEGEITLITGFEAKEGHLFEVTLDDCPD